MKDSKVITIRLNKEEQEMLKELRGRKVLSAQKTSGFIKQVLFKEFKPFLTDEERELLGILLLEMNGLGRNLNQMLKYKSFEDSETTIKLIKKVVLNAKQIINPGRFNK